MTEDTWPDNVAVHKGHDMRIFFDCERHEFSLWKSLLTDFSNRQSTFATDRLQAFRGVLAEISNTYNYKSLYGIPTKDFVEWLL